MPEQVLTRSQFLRRSAAVAAAAALPELAFRAPGAFAAGTGDTAVVLWNAAALQGVRASKLGPPMVARALAIVHEAMFEAWAAYDGVAVGPHLGRALRRPPRERTDANKREAASVAAYRAAVDLFPLSKATVFDPLLAQLGYDPSETTRAGDRAAGIGNRAADAVLDFRHRDGSNQLGDVPYADTTGYRPVNEPMDVRLPFDRSRVHDPTRWQPLVVPDAAGVGHVQQFVGAHWGYVKPFALTSGAQLRSTTPPPHWGSGEFDRQARALLELSAGLDDRQKAIAEYWADGPSSELPPGHWSLHAQFVSRRDVNDLDRDVKLFYALTTAVADAAICCWDMKRFHDTVRPVTALRYGFGGQTVSAWAGPFLGTRPIPGETWVPYQPTTFPTPPFAEYPSGHSTFSAAAAEILRRFTGSDRFGASATIAAGSSRTEPGAVPAGEVTLRWRTFSEAADEAGMSRRYGGIHFESGDLDARAAGRRVGAIAWHHAQRLFAGGR